MCLFCNEPEYVESMHLHTEARHETEMNSYRETLYYCSICFQPCWSSAHRDRHHIQNHQRQNRCGNCNTGFINLLSRHRHELYCTRRSHAHHASTLDTRAENENDQRGTNLALPPSSHMRTLISCPICNLIVSGHFHIRARHADKLHWKILHYCSICGQPCRTPVELDNHDKLNHRRETRCQKCGALFQNMITVDRHMKQCSGERRDESVPNSVKSSTRKRQWQYAQSYGTSSSGQVRPKAVCSRQGQGGLSTENNLLSGQRTQEIAYYLASAFRLPSLSWNVPYVCPKCGQGALNAYMLMLHYDICLGNSRRSYETMILILRFILVLI